nr:alpha/beta fold hydrolase [Nocardia arthritidis]
MIPGKPSDPRDSPLFVRRSGTGPALVLVHGGFPAELTWTRQRELEARWSLIVPSRRGFSPSPAAPWQDFLVDADDLAELIEEIPGGAHLVGLSYGGFGACLVTERLPHRIRSLTLVEVPLWTAAAQDRSVREFAALAGRFAASADDEQAEREFLALAGMDRQALAGKGDAIRQALELARKHRSPWEANPRFEAIVEAGIPTLVVSGDHHPAAERMCDAVAARLGAQRARVPGAGHAVPRAPGFNTMLETFLTAAEHSGGDRGTTDARTK